MVAWITVMSIFGGYFIGTAFVTKDQEKFANGLFGAWLWTLATIVIIAERVIQ